LGKARQQFSKVFRVGFVLVKALFKTRNRATLLLSAAICISPLFRQKICRWPRKFLLLSGHSLKKPYSVKLEAQQRIIVSVTCDDIKLRFLKLNRKTFWPNLKNCRLP